VELDQIDSRLLIGRNFISSFWVMMAEAAGLFDEGMSGREAPEKMPIIISTAVIASRAILCGSR
jgi:hypothetical protein